MSGDFNIDMSTESCDRNAFLTLMNLNGLHNCINYPTHVTLSSSAIIYLFITNTEAECVITNAVLSDISDHFPVICFVNISHCRLTDA